MGARLPHSALARPVLSLTVPPFINASGPVCANDRALEYRVKAAFPDLEAAERAGVKVNSRLPRGTRIVAELP